MVKFDLWFESFIFSSVYAVIILVPCTLVALWGRDMITRLGRYPTQTPAIQMSIFVKLVAVEFLTFLGLIGFYHLFTSS